MLASCFAWLLSCEGPDGSPPEPPTQTALQALTPFVPFGTIEPIRATVLLGDNDRMVLEKRFTVTLSRSASVLLRCTSPDDAAEDHRLRLVGESGELRLYGLLAETPYACALTVDGSDTEVWAGSFVTAPLPEGFPTFDVSGDASAASLDDGYILFNHWKASAESEKVHRLMMVDGSGQIRWYHALLEAKTAGIAASYLGNNEIVVGGGKTVAPSIRTLSGDILVAAPSPLEPLHGYHHEAAVTPEGWLLTLQGVTYGTGTDSFEGFLIRALDLATGDVAWQWSSEVGVSYGLLPLGSDGDHDPYHANAVQWVNDDPEGPSVWVSIRGENAILRIDRASGVPRDMVGPDRGFDLIDGAGVPLDEKLWFWGQHAPVVQGDAFLVYDNGSTRPGGAYSRVASYQIRPPGQVELVQQWTEPGWNEPNYGSIREMPGGSWFVATGHCGHCPNAGGENDEGWLLEVDPVTGTVMWRLDFTSWTDSLYRAERVDPCEIFANVRFCPEVVNR